ncbi:MAG: succinate dehydrogenase, cytochrome b556 subunit [Gammaproteobacteria bacterium]|nr:MAG: succinate dehydrogenase, cytochrome b556 subunit [Gammaproteobacteria bacterium]
MRTDNRPLSPHLQHYKLPFTATLSVLHRGTGVVNSLALSLLALLVGAAAGSPETYSFVVSIANSWLGSLMLFGFTFTLYYHLCNGIRHLFWDIGRGFEYETAQRTGKITLAVAAALSLVTWIVALAS